MNDIVKLYPSTVAILSYDELYEERLYMAQSVHTTVAMNSETSVIFYLQFTWMSTLKFAFSSPR